jgi:hypothetical protein
MEHACQARNVVQVFLLLHTKQPATFYLKKKKICKRIKSEGNGYSHHVEKGAKSIDFVSQFYSADGQDVRTAREARPELRHLEGAG